MPSEAQFLIFLVKIRRMPRKTLRHYKLGCWHFVHLLNVDTLSYAIFYFILGAGSYEVWPGFKISMDPRMSLDY